MVIIGEIFKEKVICICIKNESNVKECSYIFFLYEGLINVGIE